LLLSHLHNGHFETYSLNAGPRDFRSNRSRGCAFGDLTTMAISILSLTGERAAATHPLRLRDQNNWIKISAPSARNPTAVYRRSRHLRDAHPKQEKPHTQITKSAAAAATIPKTTLRVHFGPRVAEKVELLEVRWPSGQPDSLKDLKPNQLYYVTEGKGITRTVDSQNHQKSDWLLEILPASTHWKLRSLPNRHRFPSCEGIAHPI